MSDERGLVGVYCRNPCEHGIGKMDTDATYIRLREQNGLITEDLAYVMVRT